MTSGDVGPEEDVIMPIDRLKNGVLAAVVRVAGVAEIRAVLRPSDSRKQHGCHNRGR